MYLKSEAGTMSSDYNVKTLENTKNTYVGSTTDEVALVEQRKNRQMRTLGVYKDMSRGVMLVLR